MVAQAYGARIKKTLCRDVHAGGTNTLTLASISLSFLSRTSTSSANDGPLYFTKISVNFHLAAPLKLLASTHLGFSGETAINYGSVILPCV